MAIFHLNAKIISRSSGRSATAAAAYRAGQKIVDDRTGLVFDYTRKRQVSYHQIFAPAFSPEWACDRGRLWNSAEGTELRKDAQVAREVEVALPIELNHVEQIELLNSFVSSVFVGEGMVADVVIHNKPGNPHAHILLTTRNISANGFGQKNRSWNSKEKLQAWRYQWECQCNQKLIDAGYKCKIDSRSLEAQGIDRVPTVHIGPVSQSLKAKGTETSRAQLNTFIKEKNMKEEKIKLGIPLFNLAEEILSNAEIVEAKKRKHLFLTANDFNNHKQYRRAIGDRRYLPAMAELFQEKCLSIEETETEIGWCYKLVLSTGAVYDFGSQVKIENGTEEEIQLAVALAKSKGWKGLHVTGNDEFKEAVFLEAILSGSFTAAQITGYTPTKANVDVIKQFRPNLQLGNETTLKSHLLDRSDGDQTGGNTTASHVPRLKF